VLCAQRESRGNDVDVFLHAADAIISGVCRNRYRSFHAGIAQRPRNDLSAASCHPAGFAIKTLIFSLHEAISDGDFFVGAEDFAMASQISPRWRRILPRRNVRH